MKNNENILCSDNSFNLLPSYQYSLHDAKTMTIDEINKIIYIVINASGAKPEINKLLLDNNKYNKIIRYHNKPIKDIKYCNIHGGLVVTCSIDGTLQFYNPNTESVILKYTSDIPIWSIDIANDSSNTMY